jgi:hypothetical protein
MTTEAPKRVKWGIYRCKAMGGAVCPLAHQDQKERASNAGKACRDKHGGSQHYRDLARKRWGERDADHE